MKNWNKYYKIAFWGAVLTLLLQIIIAATVDPYLASVFTPFHSVWGIILVVGWRKEHPNR